MAALWTEGNIASRANSDLAVTAGVELGVANSIQVNLFWIIPVIIHFQFPKLGLHNNLWFYKPWSYKSLTLGVPDSLLLFCKI